MDIDLTWEPSEDLSDGTRKKLKLYYEYLQRHAAGEKNADIAKELGVTVKSVRNYEKRANAAGAFAEGVDMKDGAALMFKYVPERKPKLTLVKSGEPEPEAEETPAPDPADSPTEEEDPDRNPSVSEQLMKDPRLTRILKRDVGTWTGKECGAAHIASTIISYQLREEGLPPYHVAPIQSIMMRIRWMMETHNNEAFDYYKVMYLYEILSADYIAADDALCRGESAFQFLDRIVTVADISENWSSLLPTLQGIDQEHVLESSFLYTNLSDNLRVHGIQEEFPEYKGLIRARIENIVDGYREAAVFNKELELMDRYAGILGAGVFSISIGNYERNAELLNSRVDLLKKRIRENIYLQPDEESRSEKLELLDMFQHIEFPSDPVPESNVRAAKRYLKKPYNELITDGFDTLRGILEGA